MAEVTSRAEPAKTVCRPECRSDFLDHTMEACGFSDKYIQAKDVERRVLGHGGSSASIERCFSAATGEEFAVKRLSSLHEEKFPYLAQNEMRGLRNANGFGIPRIVKFVEYFISPGGGMYLILEFVDGTSLDDCMDLLPVGDSAVHLEKREGMVLEIAAQLMQTVCWLNADSMIAHLDITSNNVMLRKDHCTAWDELRLLDFGFAQTCCKDAQTLDIEPQGATAPYAAPELLRSLQLQYEGATPRQPGVLINGSSADWWATGIVLYELLTGELPFITHDDLASTDNSASVDGSASTDCAVALDGSASLDGQIPMDGSAAVEVLDSVCADNRVQWARYQAMLQAQKSWVDACELAHRLQSLVQHPILDRIRQCSANPDQAVLFFIHILSPHPHERAVAMDDAWCHDTICQMQQDKGLHQPEPDSVKSRRCSWGLCAALYGCWGGSSPVLHDHAAEVAHSPQPRAETKQSKAWQKYLPFKLGLNREAKEQVVAGSGSTDQIEAVTAGELQTAAAAAATGKCCRCVMRMFTFRSKSVTQHTGLATASALTKPAVDDGNGSLLTMHSDQHIAESQNLPTGQKLYASPVPIAAVSSLTHGHHEQQAQLAKSHSPMLLPHSGNACPKAALYHQHVVVQAQDGRLGTPEAAKSQTLLTGSLDAVRGVQGPGRKTGWVSRSKRFIQRLCHA